MPSPYSTKRPQGMPAEFPDFFRQHGWTRSETVFGKRDTMRYWRAMGGESLSSERQAVRASADG